MRVFMGTKKGQGSRTTRHFMSKQKLAVSGAVTVHVYSFKVMQCYAIEKRHCVCVCACVCWAL